MQWSSLFVHAFDHRSQLEQMARETGADVGRLSLLKQLLLTATRNIAEKGSLQQCSGILCDDTFGQDVLNAASGSNLWIGRPVEVPGSIPVEFEGASSIGSRLKSWPGEQVVTCLVYYSTEDNEQLRHQQELRIIELYQSCCESGHQLLLEIIPPQETLERGASLQRSVARLFEIGVRPDWWKIPCVTREYVQQICTLIDNTTPWCCGVLVLGPDAPSDELAKGFEAFRGMPQVRGFAAGHSIFGEPARQWLDGSIEDTQLISQVESNYAEIIDLWQRSTGDNTSSV